MVEPELELELEAEMEGRTEGGTTAHALAGGTALRRRAGSAGVGKMAAAPPEVTRARRHVRPGAAGRGRGGRKLALGVGGFFRAGLEPSVGLIARQTFWKWAELKASWVLRFLAGLKPAA